MTTATAAPERFDIGRVFSSGFAIVARRPLTLILLTAIFGFLPTAASLWLTTQVLPAPTPGAAPDLGGTLGRLALVELIAVVASGFSWILEGSVAAAALSDLGGRPLGLGEALTRAAPQMPIAYVLGALSRFAILIGTCLFIVPGVLLALAWSVGGIVATVEKTGFGAFRRSAELTRDNRLSLFIIFLVWGVLGVVVGLVVRLVGGEGLAAAGPAPLWMTLGLQPLASAVVQIFSTATLVAAYVELRGVKEGLAASSLASQFA